MPLGLVVAGANRPDFELLEATLAHLVARRPRVTSTSPQGLSLDKGYDYRAVYALLAAWDFTPHVRTRGEERRERPDYPGGRARRWVVERAHSWTNRFRALLVRWDKKTQNYLAALHLACAYTSFQRTGLLG